MVWLLEKTEPRSSAHIAGTTYQYRSQQSSKPSSSSGVQANMEDVSQQGNFSQTPGRNTEKGRYADKQFYISTNQILREVIIKVPILPTIHSINTVHPGMRTFHHPKPRFEACFSFDSFGLLPARTNMRRETELL